MKQGTKPTIGFIGQGFIGKSYADDYEARGYQVVRYSLDPEYIGNKDRIKSCDIVFIAVPTPTTPRGFDPHIIIESLRIIAPGTTAVIKSTIVPGTTKKLQRQFPKLFIMHSPEFLVARSAVQDAAHPSRNVIGIPKQSKEFQDRAVQVMGTFPKAPVELIVGSPEAELIKYGNNFFLYLKVLYANLMYEIARATGAEYETIAAAIGADPRIGTSHLKVMHDSGHKGARVGRGAGGLCFIKDVAAFHDVYAETTGDQLGAQLIRATIKKNIDLLVRSGKDLDLLEGVHGKSVIAKARATHKKRR